MAKLNIPINADASQFLDVIKSVLRSAEEAQKAMKKAFGDSSEIKINDTAFKEAIDSIEKSIKDLPDADIDVNIDGSKKKIDDIGKGAGKAGKKAGKEFSVGFNDILKGTLAVSAIQGLGNVARDAVTGFIDLNKEVANIGTLGVENFEEFTNLALEASKVVPDSAANIAAGAYQAISAGLTGTNEQIIEFTKTAGKVATAGLATTEEAVNGLTSVLNAYGKTAGDVGEASDTFFAAIKLGKTSFNELNSGLANVIPAASAAGISFEEVAANIAQITSLGVPTAQATTQLRSAIIELQKPGTDLAAVMSGVTVELDGVKQTLTENNIGAVLEKQGLTATLQQIEQAAADSGKTLTQAFSSSEAASAALLLTGKNAERANETLKNVRKEIEGGVSGKAYEVAAQSIDAQLQLLTNNAQAIFSQIFEALTPIVSAVLEGLNPLIRSVGFVIDNFDKLAAGIAIGAVAFGTYTLATSGAAIATSAAATATGVLNAIMALTPAVALAAGIGALVVAGLALADAFTVTTGEMLEQNQAEQELLSQKKETLQSQKSQIESNRDLIASYEQTGNRIEELKAKEKLSGVEKKELADKTKLLKEQQLKLNDSYPDAINGSKSFAENLKSVKEETGLQNAELSKLDDNTKKLIADFEELGNKENKSAEEKKRLKEITEELALEFPNAGVSAEDFAGSLSRVKDSAGLTFGELDKVNGALTKLGEQQKKLKNEELNLRFEVNQDEVEKAIDEINTDTSLNLFTNGLGKEEKEVADYVRTLKNRIQKTWDAEKLDIESTDILQQLSDRLKKAGADATAQLSIRSAFVKFFELQKERIAFNKNIETSEIDVAASLDVTTEKIVATSKATQTAVEKLKDLSNALLGNTNLDFDLPDFKGLLQLDDDIEDLTDTIAGLRIKDENLTSIDNFIDGISKAIKEVEFLRDNLQSSPQFIGKLAEENEKLTKSLQSQVDVTNATIKTIEGNLVGLKLSFDEAETEEQRQQIASQILIGNRELQDELLKAAEKRGQDITTLERSLAIERLKIEGKTEEEIKELLRKQLEDLETQKEEILKKRKELADGVVVIAETEVEKQVSTYEKLAKAFSLALASFDPSAIIDKNKEIEESIISVKSEYEAETEALDEQLAKREISYSEYSQKIVELEEEKSEKLKELQDEQIGFIDTFQIAFADSLDKMAETLKESLAEQNGEWNKAGENFVENSETLTGALEGTLAVVGAQFAQLVVEGKAGFGDLVKVVLSSVSSIIDLLLAQIVAQGAAAAPFGLGVPAALGLGALVKGLLAAAQAGIGGAEAGVIGLSESNKGKPRGADSIPMMLAPGESVINTKGTNTGQNRWYLDFVNKGGDLSSLITPNVSINPQYANSNNMSDTNKRLDVTNRKLDELSNNMKRLKVSHFYDKQPTVNVNNTIELKTNRGVL